jgi:hypothetical protein
MYTAKCLEPLRNITVRRFEKSARGFEEIGNINEQEVATSYTTSVSMDILSTIFAKQLIYRFRHVA